MVVFHYKNDLLALPAIFHSVISSFFIQNKAGVGGTVQVAFKDVRANCFCASLLRTQIHMPRHATSCHAMHRARAQSTKINNDRADGHCCSFDWI